MGFLVHLFHSGNEELDLTVDPAFKADIKVFLLFLVSSYDG